MTINKSWYWAIGSAALLVTSFILRQQAMNLIRKAFHRGEMNISAS